MHEGGIGPDHFIVAESHKGHIFNGREFAEGQPRAPNKRPDKADNKGNKGRQHKYGPIALYCFFHGKAPLTFK
jgi:hypothetical protein